MIPQTALNVGSCCLLMVALVLFPCTSPCTLFADVILIHPDDSITNLGGSVSYPMGSGITSGEILVADGTSSINVSGGNLDGAIELAGDSVLNIVSGRAGQVFVFDNATTVLSGGSIGLLGLDTGFVNISGGETFIDSFNEPFAGFSRNINISGGMVEVNFNGVESEDANIEVSGGAVAFRNMDLRDSAVTISGGVNNPEIDGELTSFFLYGSSNISLVGSNFAIQRFSGDAAEPLIPIAFGQYALSDLQENDAIVGTLADGNSVSFSTSQLQEQATVSLVSAVPEPSAFFALSALAFAATTRRRRS